MQIISAHWIHFHFCLQASLISKLMAEPVFHESADGGSLEEQRHLTMRQIKALVEMEFCEKGMNKELYKVSVCLVACHILIPI